MKKNKEYIVYNGVQVEVIRRFVYKDEKKIEVRNNSNNQQFIIKETDINQ